MEAYHEVISMSKDNSEAGLGIILSIGTGERFLQRLHDKKGYRRYYQFLRTALYYATDTHQVHENMGLLSKNSSHFAYHRFNVPDCLHEIKLDHWKPARGNVLSTKDRIRAITSNYLTEEETVRDLKELASTLVANRRKRAKTERWSDYLGFRYRCNQERCGEECTYLREFRTHVCEKHIFKDFDDQNDDERCRYDAIIAESRILE